MSVFITQLRILLGLPPVQPDLATPAKAMLRLWEIDEIMKSRTVEQLTVAKRTLLVRKMILCLYELKKHCNIRQKTVILLVEYEEM